MYINISFINLDYGQIIRYHDNTCKVDIICT